MDKNAGESTISSSEKVRTEVEENDDEDEDSGKEEEDNEEDESEDEEEEQQLYDIKLSKNSLVKEPWTHGEDMDLKRLVEEYGAKRWAVIATKLAGRKGKQCRERWHNHLDPAVNKTNWSAEEDTIIEKYQRVYGNKWAEITKHLSGRTDNSIKNRYYSTQRKRQRMATRESYSSPPSTNTDDSPSGSLSGVVGSSSFPLQPDSTTSHSPRMRRGEVLDSSARRHATKHKATTSKQTEREGEGTVDDLGDDTNDCQGILTTSHRIGLLQKLLKKGGVAKNDDTNNEWKAVSLSKNGIELNDIHPLTVAIMGDVQLREYMLALSAPWAKAIAEGIPEPIGPPSISPRPSPLSTEECIMSTCGGFWMPHSISPHFSSSLPELPLVGIRLPNWQAELLSKDKVDVFDGAEVVGLALQDDNV